MSTWAAMGAGGRAVILVLGAVAAGGVGYAVWDRAQGVPAAEQGASAPDAAAPAAEAPVAEAAVAEPQPVSVLPPVQPVIGTWAVTADGSCTVAGTAVAGALVKVLVDGAPVAETVATAGGEFALVTTLAPNPAPSVMSLVMVLPDGTEVPGAATVALGPIAGPEVAAEAAPAAVMVTDEGAVVLQEAPVEEAAAEAAVEEAPVAEGAVAEVPVAEVVIETITYTPGGAVQLGGAGQPGAFVRLYLDNALIQEVLVPDSGKWLTTLKDTAPGIYTLRADQVDAAGKVTARFETPFKRETPEALAAAAAGGMAAAEPAAEPVAEVVAAEPAAEATTAEPAAEPVAEVAAAEPAAEATAAEPAAEPVAEVAAAEPAAEATAAEPAAEPVAEVAAAEPAAEPVAEVAAAEPVAEATAAEPAAEPEAEVAAAEPAAEATAAEPAAEPVAEVAAAEPAAEATVAEPAAEPVAEVAAAEPVPEPAAEPVAAVPLAEAAEEPVAEVAVAEPAPPPAPVTITVQPGYTLWGIAEGEMGDGVLYVQVWEANKDQIKDPDLIYPGQVFTMPAETAQP